MKRNATSIGRMYGFNLYSMLHEFLSFDLKKKNSPSHHYYYILLFLVINKIDFKRTMDFKRLYWTSNALCLV